MILGVDDPPSDALIYLSGPEKFMKNLEAEFLTNGVKRHQIVTDFFPGYRTAD
jgi:ferredoxin-NADP reductase